MRKYWRESATLTELPEFTLLLYSRACKCFDAGYVVISVLRQGDNETGKKGSLTLGLVLLGAAHRLLRFRIYEIVIGMRADVLSHS